MKTTTNFLWGFLVGSLLGAGVAILTAPQAGEDFRNQIRDGYTRIQVEVKKASQQKRSEMEEQLAALREPRRPAEDSPELNA